MRINTFMTLDDHILFEKYIKRDVVKEDVDPVGQEDKDVNNDGVVNKQDEYLLKRRAAISAAIASKEKNEEEEATSTHYNTSHEALDLIDALLASPKKYKKADLVKILTLASDHLQHKIQ
jgi:hypothetical protein